MRGTCRLRAGTRGEGVLRAGAGHAGLGASEASLSGCRLRVSLVSRKPVASTAPGARARAADVQSRVRC